MALGGSGGKGGNKSAIKAGEAFVELSADDSKLTSALKRVVNKIQSVSLKVAKIGFGASVAGATMLTPIIGLFREAAKHGDDIQDAADRAGSSAEGISRLSYAADLSAASLEDVEAANQKLTKSAVAATRGGKEQARAFTAMGISAEDFLELDVDERFVKIAETLEDIESPLQKDAFLFDLFGKSAGGLKPLFKDGADGLRELLDESDRVGQTMSGDDTAKAAKVMDAYDRSLKAVKFTLLSIGASLFGFSDNIEQGSQAFVTVMKSVRDFITENRKVIVIITAVGAALLAGGAIFGGFGLAIAGIVSGITALSAILLPLLPWIIGITAGIAGTVAAFYNLNTVLKLIGIDLVAITAGIRGDLIESIMGIGDTFGTMFGGILDALSGGNLELAGKIAIVGLTLVFERGILFMTKAWVRFKNFFVDIWKDIVAGVKLIWTDLMGWLDVKLIEISTGILLLLKKMDFANVIPESADDIAKGGELAKKESQAQTVKDRNAIIDARKNQQREDDKFRADQLKAQQDVVNTLADLLNQLVESAQKRNGPDKIQSDFDEKRLQKIADGVKGAFQSSDFRGLLAQGPANQIAKDQLKEQKEMRKELVEIRKKVGPEVFE